MEAINAVLPVFIMLMVGVISRKYQIIDRNGIAGVKKIAANLLLPFVLFNALGTASYNAVTALVFVVMFTGILISLLAGYLLKPIIAENVRNHLPFMVSGFEAGMFGYPLYIALVGAQHLHTIAIIDIANCIFAFTIYIGLMTASEKGSGSAKELTQSALHAPAFYGIVLGIIFGVTNLLHRLIASPFGNLYSSSINMFIAPVSALSSISGTRNSFGGWRTFYERYSNCRDQCGQPRAVYGRCLSSVNVQIPTR
jgi:malate permease and related proteins